MQSVSVAYVKDYFSETSTGNTLSPIEKAYLRFREQIESDESYTEEVWNECFNIPRAVEMGLRHEECRGLRRHGLGQLPHA